MKRPNMEEIEDFVKTFERPSSKQSAEMIKYIYFLEHENNKTALKKCLNPECNNMILHDQFSFCAECVINWKKQNTKPIDFS